MDLHLRGKKALVLASSQGLGLGVAAALCGEGAAVGINGRDEGKLVEAAARLTDKGPGTASACAADLSLRDSSQLLYRTAIQKMGHLDILVNNVAGPPPGGVVEQNADTWRTQFDSMVVRLIEMTNLCLSGMRERKWGRILTIASSSIIQPIDGLGISNTLRSALVGWSKSLANEVAPHNITVNILAPGRIETERVKQIDSLNAKKQHISIGEERRRSMASIPVGRYGTVEEFGAVAAFLLSERAAYITGSVIRCDGGLIRSV